MNILTIVETGGATILFCAIFLLVGSVRPFKQVFHNQRGILSMFAGMSVAYVFVHLMPELHGARRAFVESVSVQLRFEGMAIYYVALIGFLVFYGLDHLRAHLRKSATGEESELEFKIHIGGFAAYVWLMSYLLNYRLEDTPMSTALYTLAIALHFLGINHALQNEHGEAYDRVGRYVLAGATVLGWVSALIFELPRDVIALLVAFISGAIIMNSTIMELPSESDGRFVPFLAGGIIYGLILLPLG